MIFANSATLCGKVIKDPLLSKTKNGKSVCKIVLVVERTIGNSTKKSDYIPITLWSKKADVANKIVRRGDELMVMGTVAQEKWETSENEKRSRIVVQADKFWVIPPEESIISDNGNESEDSDS